MATRPRFINYTCHPRPERKRKAPVEFDYRHSLFPRLNTRRHGRYSAAGPCQGGTPAADVAICCSLHMFKLLRRKLAHLLEAEPRRRSGAGAQGPVLLAAPKATALPKGLLLSLTSLDSFDALFGGKRMTAREIDIHRCPAC